MHMISYRGPRSSGGVSSALSHLVGNHENVSWSYMQESALQLNVLGSIVKCQIPKEVPLGHYRCCNEFIWPVMHDFPQKVRFAAGDRELYSHFSSIAAACLYKATCPSSPYFVQDYQFAFLPANLTERIDVDVLAFWHIPWPKTVSSVHVPAVRTSKVMPVKFGQPQSGV